MKLLNGPSQPLPLMGGVVQRQCLVVPAAVIANLRSYRHACRLAWKLRFPRNLTYRSLVEQAGPGTLYLSHVSDYFSRHENRRELPARHIAITESVLGNKVISQYLNRQSELTCLEELQATARYAA